MSNTSGPRAAMIISTLCINSNFKGQIINIGTTQRCIIKPTVIYPSSNNCMYTGGHTNNILMNNKYKTKGELVISC